MHYGSITVIGMLLIIFIDNNKTTSYYVAVNSI